MTKVQVTYKLQRPLAEADWTNISRVHSVYGFFAVRPKAGATSEGDELFVEYDSSRLSRKDVRRTLEEHGLPLAAAVVAPEPVPEPSHEAGTKPAA